MRSKGFSDIHQHVLWGLDDGSQTAKQMKALLRQDAQSGVNLVFATTHAHPKLRAFNYDLYRQRLAEANAFCRANELPLRVVSGCEIRYSDVVADHLRAGRLPTLGDTRHVLIEFEPHTRLHEILDAADKLYMFGFAPVLAHVERYRCLAAAPKSAMEIRDEYGLLYQMNCDTVLQPRGFWVRRFAKRMLEERAIDAIASDAHDTVHRPVHMRGAYRKIAEEYGADYADRLVRLGWEFVKEKVKNDA